ncbi:MAG: hypothetical protein U1E77_06695 [Inhella sp.]
MPEAALELPPGCQLRLAQAGDVPALHALHEAVLARCPTPACSACSAAPKSFFQTHCGQRGESWVVAQGGQLLGYAALTLPMADDADNYALNLGWPAERARRVGLLSAAMVRPSRSRQGLAPSLDPAAAAAGANPAGPARAAGAGGAGQCARARG